MLSNLGRVILKLVLNKKYRLPIFQVLLLNNARSLDVEVQESTQVDYGQVKEHLDNGGSVFITTKESKKLSNPRSKAQSNYSDSRRSYGALIQQHLRKP